MENAHGSMSNKLNGSPDEGIFQMNEEVEVISNI